MSECFKKHPTLHLLTGIGLGLILVALLGDGLVANAMMLGVVAVVVGVGSEFVFGQK